MRYGLCFVNRRYIKLWAMVWAQRGVSSMAMKYSYMQRSISVITRGHGGQRMCSKVSMRHRTAQL